MLTISQEFVKHNITGLVIIDLYGKDKLAL
jgi:hypothetical protein